MKKYQTVLKRCPPISVHENTSDSRKLDAAGVLIIHPRKQKPPEFCMLLPKQDPKKTTPPQWQIPKGGIEKGEDKVVAALREAEEEVGLAPREIRRLFDLGPVPYTSATTGKEKQMWLFAAVVENKKEALHGKNHPRDPKTAGWQWFTRDEFVEAGGRADHIAILDNAWDILKDRPLKGRIKGGVA